MLRHLTSSTIMFYKLRDRINLVTQVCALRQQGVCRSPFFTRRYFADLFPNHVRWWERVWRNLTMLNAMVRTAVDCMKRKKRTAGVGSREVSSCTIAASFQGFALFRFLRFDIVGRLIVVLLLR